MSIIEAYNQAMQTGNLEALDEVVHDELIFNPHVGGVTMGKSVLMGLAGSGAVTGATPLSDDYKLVGSE